MHAVRNQNFLNEGVTTPPPIIGVVLGGQVPKLHDLQSNTLRPSKVKYHFFDTFIRVQAYLLLRYCIKNQFTGVD